MRRAFVTGAARGIGAAIAERLRADGVEVIAPTRARLDLAFVESAREYLTGVNAVCPGFVATEMTRANNSDAQIQALAEQTALNRLATPDEIAELVVFLVSPRNTYITGQTLVIDGGFSCQ